MPYLLYCAVVTIPGRFILYRIFCTVHSHYTTGRERPAVSVVPGSFILYRIFCALPVVRNNDGAAREGLQRLLEGSERIDVLWKYSIV